MFVYVVEREARIKHLIVHSTASKIQLSFDTDVSFKRQLYVPF